MWYGGMVVCFFEIGRSSSKSVRVYDNTITDGVTEGAPQTSGTATRVATVTTGSSEVYHHTTIPHFFESACTDAELNIDIVWSVRTHKCAMDGTACGMVVWWYVLRGRYFHCATSSCPSFFCALQLRTSYPTPTGSVRERQTRRHRWRVCA